MLFDARSRHFSLPPKRPCAKTISKDSGFDPFIKHLKTQKVFSCRSKAIEDIPLLKAGQGGGPEGKAGGVEKPEDKLEMVLANLRQRGAAKPRSVKTLTSTIHALFSKQLEVEQVASLIEALKVAGYIKVDGTKVNYSL